MKKFYFLLLIVIAMSISCSNNSSDIDQPPPPITDESECQKAGNIWIGQECFTVPDEMTLGSLDVTIPPSQGAPVNIQDKSTTALIMADHNGERIEFLFYDFEKTSNLGENKDQAPFSIKMYSENALEKKNYDASAFTWSFIDRTSKDYEAQYNMPVVGIVQIDDIVIDPSIGNCDGSAAYIKGKVDIDANPLLINFTDSNLKKSYSIKMKLDFVLNIRHQCVE